MTRFKGNRPEGKTNVFRDDRGDHDQPGEGNLVGAPPTVPTLVTLYRIEADLLELSAFLWYSLSSKAVGSLSRFDNYPETPLSLLHSGKVLRYFFFSTCQVCRRHRGQNFRNRSFSPPGFRRRA